MKYLIRILFLVFASSCSYNQQEIHKGNKYLGLYIDNGPRQGFQYFDSLGREYNYRYITTSITNDSLVPVQIKINLSKDYNHPCTSDSVKFKIFLLPRKLTPEKQQFDESISKELKHFLDTETETLVSLNKLLNPKEKCVMTFGTLTSINYLEPWQLGLISKGHEFEYYAHDSIIKQVTSTNNPLTLSLGIDFQTFGDSDKTNCYLVIPCGQISFPGN